ncbi:hypothetical protein C2E23DRAFT_886210 [Lenzites betulinus]|nr:hypothetical protein C2E23DRAFT_886210 [Lenzites betulinus]
MPRPPRCENAWDCDNSCGNADASALKCCSGCKKVWYCSKECQKRDWRRHIFDCTHTRPIPTAYYLSRACAQRVFPIHRKTRTDFGFEKAELLWLPCAQTELLALWIIVFRDAGMSEKDVQKWQATGTLVDGIEATFARLPRDALLDDASAFFNAHRDLFDGSPADKAEAEAAMEDSCGRAIRKGWVKTGGPPVDDPGTIVRKISAMPEHFRDCHLFYALLAVYSHPGPLCPEWLSFGIVAARDEGDAFWIGRWYDRLIEVCTFDAFAAAYRTSSLLSLGEAHGIHLSCSLSGAAKVLFFDVMSESPRGFKTVWPLKQYVDRIRDLDSDSSAPRPSLSQAAQEDYGFVNCRDATERKLLDQLCLAYFAHLDADPLDLHKACVRGALVEYVSGFVKLKPKTKAYRRLLRNAYSSLAGEDGQGSVADDSKALVRWK